MKPTDHLQQGNPLYDPCLLPDERYALILANPPFNGALDKTSLNPQLRGGKTELLFLDLICNLPKLGGRTAIVVPSGMLFGRSKAHRTLRKALLHAFRLIMVVQLPRGTFQVKPPRWAKQRGKLGTGVAAYLLLFSKGSETDIVHFCEPVELVGDPLRPDWTATRDEIIANDYDLSPNRYRPLPEPEPLPPVEDLLNEIQTLETQIAQTTLELQQMLTDIGYLNPMNETTLTSPLSGDGYVP